MIYGIVREHQVQPETYDYRVDVILYDFYEIMHPADFRCYVSGLVRTEKSCGLCPAPGAGANRHCRHKV